MIRAWLQDLRDFHWLRRRRPLYTYFCDTGNSDIRCLFSQTCKRRYAGL